MRHTTSPVAKTTLLAHALVTYPIYDVGSVMHCRSQLGYRRIRTGGPPFGRGAPTVGSGAELSARRSWCVRLRPADVALLEQTPLDLAALTSTYDRLQAWNFSHEFLSRIPEHLVVTRADDLGWSDWGTPEAIERSFAAIGMVPPWRGPAEAVG